MQEIFGALRASQRPVIFFPPLVGAHDENLYRLAGKFILHALKQVVIPLQSNFVFIVFGGCGSKINLTDFSAASGVTSNGHKQMLPFARRFTSTVRFDSDVVAQRSSLENVVPGSNGEHGNVDVSEVLFDRYLLPILVIGGMSQPIEKIWGQGRRGNRRRGRIRKIKQRIGSQR